VCKLRVPREHTGLREGACRVLARQPAETFNVQENTVAKIIVVTSGKGGVGKTTTSANFATGLAL